MKVGSTPEGDGLGGLVNLCELGPGPEGVLIVRSRICSRVSRSLGNGEGFREPSVSISRTTAGVLILRSRRFKGGVDRIGDEASTSANRCEARDWGPGDIGASPGMATPFFPNTGCDVVLLLCSNCVGSWASCCGACLFILGPVSREPIKAANEMDFCRGLSVELDGLGRAGGGLSNGVFGREKSDVTGLL
jgi:hypothetical protein